jgi:hypothetical protein
MEDSEAKVRFNPGDILMVKGEVREYNSHPDYNRTYKPANMEPGFMFKFKQARYSADTPDFKWYELESPIWLNVWETTTNKEYPGQDHHSWMFKEEDLEVVFTI